MLFIINNLGIPVNTKSHLSDSVVEAWKAAMVTVNKLVSAEPHSAQTGALLLGLATWHLYPDMIISNQGRNSSAVDVHMKDTLVRQGGILTLSIQDARRNVYGIY
jgi:hypothetical protein